jgi:hypothetical protein
MGYIATFSDTDRADRREVQIAATLRDADGPRDIALLDLSVTGFRAKLATPLKVGATITIGTRSLGVREAVVAWVKGPLCGVEFVVPLTHSQVLQAREIDTVVQASFDADGQAGGEDVAARILPSETANAASGRLPIAARIGTIVGLSALGWGGIAAIALTVRTAFF